MDQLSQVIKSGRPLNLSGDGASHRATTDTHRENSGVSRIRSPPLPNTARYSILEKVIFIHEQRRTTCLKPCQQPCVPRLSALTPKFSAAIKTPVPDARRYIPLKYRVEQREVPNVREKDPSTILSLRVVRYLT